jgi:hypothetical protein
MLCKPSETYHKGRSQRAKALTHREEGRQPYFLDPRVIFALCRPVFVRWANSLAASATDFIQRVDLQKPVGIGTRTRALALIVRPEGAIRVAGFGTLPSQTRSGHT